VRKIEVEPNAFKRIKNGIQPGLLCCPNLGVGVGEEILLVDKEHRRQVFKTISHITTQGQVSILYFGVVPPGVFVDLDKEPALFSYEHL
jgi:hypothetical protein